MFGDWILTTLGTIGYVTLTAVGIYAALIFFTRVAGLRSFSKISSFDFPITVAMGSLLATTIIVKKPPLLQAMFALGLLFLFQYAIAAARRWEWVCGLVDNQPLLLMRGETVIEENLREAKVTYEDLRGKLREANVLDLSQVRAVVFETTGDISVLHTDDPEQELDATLLQNVADAPEHETDPLRAKSE